MGHRRPIRASGVTLVADGEWLTVRQAARHLELSLTSVRRYITQGCIASRTVTRRRTVLMRRSDLEAFVGEARLEPGALRHLDQSPTTFVLAHE